LRPRRKTAPSATRGPSKRSRRAGHREWGSRYADRWAPDGSRWPRAEFAEKLARLNSTATGNERIRGGFLGMLTAICEREIPAGSYRVPDSISTRIGGTPAFQPARGAFASLLGSQGLVSIQDDSLRSEPASWSGQMDDLAAALAQVVDVN